MDQTKIDTRILFQRADKLWPIADKLLTDTELERLMALMPSTGFILISHPGDISVSHAGLLDQFVDKYSDTTLQEAAAGLPLSARSKSDIINALRNDTEEIINQQQ